MAKQKNCAVLSTNNRAFELKICRHETVYLQGKMTHFSRNMTQFNLLEKKKIEMLFDLNFLKQKLCGKQRNVYIVREAASFTGHLLHVSDRIVFLVIGSD